MVELIAEVGSVHDGSFGNAKKLIALAASVGASTVKFQTHIAAAETVRDAPSPSYFSDEPRFDYFERTAFDEQQWLELREQAHKEGVRFMSSPFSIEAVDLLDRIGVDAYKVASGEVTNVPMLERLAELDRPIYVSSGMSSWQELDRAVDILSGTDLTVLQCSSRYPCPPEAVGLNIIGEMRDRWTVPIGFSDHTDGAAAAIAAVALGAVAVEKHLTFSRSMYGSDAPFATEPDAFAELAQSLDAVTLMLDHPVDKAEVADYDEMRAVFEKSVVAREATAEGTELTMEHLAFKKPGTGWPASRYRELLGRTVARDLAADHLIVEDDLR